MLKVSHRGYFLPPRPEKQPNPLEAQVRCGAVQPSLHEAWSDEAGNFLCSTCVNIAICTRYPTRNLWHPAVLRWRSGCDGCRRTLSSGTARCSHTAHTLGARVSVRVCERRQSCVIQLPDCHYWPSTGAAAVSGEGGTAHQRPRVGASAACVWWHAGRPASPAAPAAGCVLPLDCGTWQVSLTRCTAGAPDAWWMCAICHAATGK